VLYGEAFLWQYRIHMKILFAVGIYPPQVGGPSHYSYSLNQKFKKIGIETGVATYGYFLRLPSIIRHFAYFWKLLALGRKCDVILGFDSVSVGLPAIFAGKILRKKVILRLGGDFLWEQYVERTKEKIPLSQFYKQKRFYTCKERIIFNIINYVVQKSDVVVFSTPWFRDIFVEAYKPKIEKTIVIENAIEALHNGVPPTKKNFIWAGRPIFLKNTESLRKAFNRAEKIDPSLRLDMFENLSHNELMEKIKKCYAVIYPSISEVSPNLVLEALAFGKPSIVTMDTGYANLLQDVALFVDPLSEEDVAEKILFLAEEKNYQEISLRVQAFRRTHTYTEIADKYLKLFQTFL